MIESGKVFAISAVCHQHSFKISFHISNKLSKYLQFMCAAVLSEFLHFCSIFYLVYMG